MSRYKKRNSGISGYRTLLKYLKIAYSSESTVEAGKALPLAYFNFISVIVKKNMSIMFKAKKNRIKRHVS